MKPINLGRKYDNAPCCAPCETKPEDRICFPSIYLDDLGVKIPDSGTITLRFEVSSRNERLKDDKASVNLDILQILDITEDSKADEKLSASQTLDKLAKEVTKEYDPADSEDDASREQYVADES